VHGTDLANLNLNTAVGRTDTLSTSLTTINMVYRAQLATVFR